MASSDDHLRFCWTLRGALGENGNLCFSPYSIASALGLLGQAVRGRAAEELGTLLVGTEPDLLRKASTLETAELAVMNTLWAWDELVLAQDFADAPAQWPGGRVASAPFVTDPEGARRVVNADVAETTRGLIPELLPPGAVADDTVAALVNALYLKAAWSKPFTEQNTALAAFYAPDGIRDVSTMWQEGLLGYTAADGWQVVTLPAAGGVEAVILLPDGELAEQEAALDAPGLARLLGSSARVTVRLSLPKVDIDVRSPLTDTLKSLGVRTVFTPKADFSPISPDPRLAVGDVLHQAVLRLDEQGLEGAAATAVTMRALSMLTSDPVEVVVDRPFLLLVRHAETGVVYFFTRVVEP